MTPSVYSSSYQRYKEDTSVFTTWLSNAAKSCGHVVKADETTAPQAAQSHAPPSEPPRATRLKGKERKLAKQAATVTPDSRIASSTSPPQKKYKISVSELLKQAEAVASWTKKTIRLPEDVQHVLQRAITARHRCTAWFKQTGLQNEYSNEGHEHFVDILERALDLLRGPASSTPAAGVPSRHEDPLANMLNNRFGALNLDDGAEIDLEVEGVMQPPSTAPVKSTRSEPTAVYELESEIWDVAFAIYCFFEDVHQLQAHLVGVWKQQRNGEVDLLSATEVTTTALDLLWHSEAQLHSEYQSHFHYSRIYDNLTTVIFSADAIRSDKDPEEALRSPERLKILPFDEFIYLPTARTLMKFASMRELLQLETWPPPVPPMRFSYIINPALLESPRLQKYEREDKLLTQFMLDIALADELKSQMVQMGGEDPQTGGPVVADVLTSYLRRVWTDDNITVTNVFASRLWLDIVDLHDGQPNTGGELAVEAALAQKTFDFKIGSDGVLDAGGGLRWLGKDSSLMLELYGLKHSIEQPTFGEFKRSMPDMDPAIKAAIEKQLKEKYPDWKPPEQKHVDNAKRLNIQHIRPHEDENFLTNYNPIYCGTAALLLALKTEEAGIALANHHMTIFATAHLYNALKQLHVIDIEWPALDRIIALQVGPIFAGQRPGDVPKTPQAIQSHLELRVGLKSNQKLFDKKMPWKLQVCGAGVAMRTQLVSEDMRIHASHMIQDDWLADLEPKTKYNKPRRHVSLVQFVKEFSDVMPHLVRDIRIDYIGLTKICKGLMTAIRVKMFTELRINYPSMKKPEESNDHGPVFMVLEILTESRTAEMKYLRLRDRRDKTVFPGGEQLLLAGRVMEDFLRDKHRTQIKDVA
ncbi:hypothetical protein LTR10_012519 [Elasticomyces elasticus]|nr:hypothetical protein LTR10_012519 [Elasticomyces elasticus]KAK4965993.1 hypothetical protein LTR42_012007 [Elasticomyces elasticus]